MLMSDPIPHSSLFYTPQSLIELDERIKMLAPDEQGLVYRYVMETFNLSYKLIKDGKDT
jgi:hypothetical protein